MSIRPCLLLLHLHLAARPMLQVMRGLKNGFRRRRGNGFLDDEVCRGTPGSCGLALSCKLHPLECPAWFDLVWLAVWHP